MNFIEIQLKNEYNMIKRSLYYWSKMYEEQLNEGDDYSKLERTICINILNFKYLDNNRFHNGYRLKEIETNEELTDLQEIHFIEIPKLKRFESTEEIVDLLEGWVEFLRDPESEVVRKLEMTNKEIREAKDTLYKLREKSIKDEISALANAEERGIQKEKIETVLRLNSIGLDVSQIAVGAGIIVEEVESIIDRN